jgi:hypothetical protein
MSTNRRTKIRLVQPHQRRRKPRFESAIAREISEGVVQVEVGGRKLTVFDTLKDAREVAVLNCLILLVTQ